MPWSVSAWTKTRENVRYYGVAVLAVEADPLPSFTVDRCPMYFDDGSNPWKAEENHIRVFRFDDSDSSHSDALLPSVLTLTAAAFLRIV